MDRVVPRTPNERKAMKRYSILVIAILFVVCTTWLVADRESSMRADQEPKKPIDIPLKSIYSTSGQEGLKHVKERIEEPYGKDLEEIYRKTQGMGASNIFLARGQDIAEVVNATLRVFTGILPADVPAEPFKK